MDFRILSILSSLNDSIRASLHSNIDLWFVLLLWFTGLVVVGVILEGSKHLSSEKYTIDLKTGTAHFPWRRKQLIRRLAIWGWALVSLGVAGELVAEVFVSRYEGYLRSFNDILSASAEREVALARSEAKSASATAKGFESQIEESKARVKTAEAQIASANAASKDAVAKVTTAEARIAEANRAAAEANRIAGTERLARLQLEVRLAPRTLTDEQQSRLIEMLSPFQKIAVDVVLFGDTYEIQSIGNL